MLCASAHEKCAPLHTVGVAVPLAVFQAALVAELRLCRGQLVVPCGDGSSKFLTTQLSLMVYTSFMNVITAY